MKKGALGQLAQVDQLAFTAGRCAFAARQQLPNESAQFGQIILHWA